MRDALNLLRFAATLRPRRVRLSARRQHSAPAAGGNCRGSSRLSTVSPEPSPTRPTTSRPCVSTSPTLTAILDEGVWKDRIAAHCENVAQWREGAAAATFLFRRCRCRLAAVVGPKRHPRGAHSPVGNESGGQYPARPRDCESARRQARRSSADRDDGPPGGRTTRREYFWAGAQPAREPASQSRVTWPVDWLRIMEARPGGAGFLETAIEDLRRVLDRHAPPAIEAIMRLRQTEPVPALDGALACAAQAIESLTDLFPTRR